MEIAFLKITVRRVVTLIAVAFVVVLAAGQVAAAKAITGCSLIRVAEVRTILGSPAVAHRGGSASECILRGGDRLPIVLLVNSKGKAGYVGLKNAQGPPWKAVRSLGTEAVTYDHVTDNPEGVLRGVIVRKGTHVLQLSVTAVGMNPPGLPTIAQLVKLARIAVQRI
jgi:hypothetical protein